MAAILIAEDDEITRITVRDRLRKNRWEVDAVANGREAVARLKQKRYNLVITDIRMPDLDGWALLDYIRRHTPGTGTLIMSSFATEEEGGRALREGAAGYLVKPFDLDELVGKVGRLMQRQNGNHLTQHMPFPRDATRR